MNILDTSFSCSSSSPVPQCAGKESISGSEVLDYLGVNGVDRSMPFNVLMLFVFFILFRLLAYIVLRFFRRIQTRD